MLLSINHHVIAQLCVRVCSETCIKNGSARAFQSRGCQPYHSCTGIRNRSTQKRTQKISQELRLTHVKTGYRHINAALGYG